jgi:hypothetical protein
MAVDLIAANDEVMKFTGTDELGVVFGWAIVCKDKDGNDYFDLHGDHIPEDAMLAASLEYALADRDAKVMHAGKVVGKMAFIWPVTTDMVEKNGWATKQTGLLVGWKPECPDTIALVKAGKLAGFSMGGQYGETEELADA